MRKRLQRSLSRTILVNLDVVIGGRSVETPLRGIRYFSSGDPPSPIISAFGRRPPKSISPELRPVISPSHSRPYNDPRAADIHDTSSMDSIFQRLPIAGHSLSLGLIFSIIALVFLGFKVRRFVPKYVNST